VFWRNVINSIQGQKRQAALTKLDAERQRMRIHVQSLGRIKDKLKVAPLPATKGQEPSNAIVLSFYGSIRKELATAVADGSETFKKMHNGTLSEIAEHLDIAVSYIEDIAMSTIGSGLHVIFNEMVNRTASSPT